MSTAIEDSRYWVHAQLDALVSGDMRKATDRQWLYSRAHEYARVEIGQAHALSRYGTTHAPPGLEGECSPSGT